MYGRIRFSAWYCNHSNAVVVQHADYLAPFMPDTTGHRASMFSEISDRPGCLPDLILPFEQYSTLSCSGSGTGIQSLGSRWAGALQTLC